MTSRAEIIAEARDWLGTKWQHQGRLKHIGTDCAGLVIETGKTLGCVPTDGSADIKGYGREPDVIKMKGALDFLFDRVPKSEQKPGDIAWMRAGGEKKQHLGIIAMRDNRPTLIHAINYKLVEEVPIESFTKHRILAVYRYRNLSD